jgi:hypothetical protein
MERKKERRVSAVRSVALRCGGVAEMVLGGDARVSNAGVSPDAVTISLSWPKVDLMVVVL